MPATVNGGGDVLARGGVRATFRGPEVSQEKWDAIWGKEDKPKLNNMESNEPKVTNPPVKRKRSK